MAEYKCPACAAVISSYDGRLKCPACGSVYDEETLKEYEKELERITSDSIEWGDYAPAGELSKGYLFYVCKSCSGRFVTLGGQDASEQEKCPYCDNALVVDKETASAPKPDIVLPFKFDKASAEDALKKFCALKPLLPADYAKESRVDEIKALYVPYWLFSCETEGRLRSDGVKVRKQKDGDVDVTNNDHFMVIREGSAVFSQIRTDGFEVMPEKYMRTTEPFDPSDGREFKDGDLSDVLAEISGIDSDAVRPKADKTVKSGMEKLLCGTMSGYSRITPQSREIKTKNGKITFALFPVWILSTQYKGKIYRFVMNAQTGKRTGELPVGKTRLMAFFGGITAGVTLIGFIISLFL